MAMGGSSIRRLVQKFGARTLRHARLGFLAALIAAATSSGAEAQKKLKAPGTEAAGQSESKADAGRIKSPPESRDEAPILAALDELEKAGDGGKAAAAPLEALLRRGANVKILTRALTVSGAMK